MLDAQRRQRAARYAALLTVLLMAGCHAQPTGQAPSPAATPSSTVGAKQRTTTPAMATVAPGVTAASSPSVSPPVLLSATPATDRPPALTANAAPPQPSARRSDPTVAQKVKARALRVAVIGDSLTDYRSAGGHYVRLLKKWCPQSQFDNFGKGGEMVNQMRRRIRRHLHAAKGAGYSHVVIFGGVNDLYSDLTAHRTVEKIRGDLEKMYTWSHNAKAQVVAITVAPWGGFTRYFNSRRGENTLALNRWILEQQGGLVDVAVDSHSLLRCGDANRLCPQHRPPFNDGIHFGKPAHELLARELKDRAFSNCR